MKGRVVTGLVWLAIVASSHVNAGGSPVNDHLLPVEEVSDAQSPEGAYERLWRQKLLVTPGEIARSVHLPGNVGVETAVSVYRNPLSNGEYRVTATQTSASLWRCVAPDAPEPVNPDSIEVSRLEAPLPETTAFAIQKVWRAMLLDVQKRPKSDELLLESSTEIFSAAAADGKLLIGQFQGLGQGNTAALSALAHLLLQYCDSPETERVEIARAIEKAASDLLGRVASNSGNNPDDLQKARYWEQRSVASKPAVTQTPALIGNIADQLPAAVAMIGVANTGSKQQPIQFLLSVSQERPNSGFLALQLILLNTSRVLQDLSKAGKINVTCKIGTPTLYVPGQYIGITRSLEPEIAALKLKPGKWVTQEIALQPELSAKEIAEISASCEIGGVVYKSNTIYLSEK